MLHPGTRTPSGSGARRRVAIPYEQMFASGSDGQLNSQRTDKQPPSIKPPRVLSNFSFRTVPSDAMRLGQGISVGHQRTCRAGGLCLLTVLAVILVVAAPAATASPLTWSTPRQVDHAAPFGNPSRFASLTCLSSTWCLATDGEGNVATSTDPAGGLWSTATVSPDPVIAISCPSASLCVGTARNGNIVTSTDPTGGAGAWQTTSIAPGHTFSPISCPSTPLCVVSDTAGDVFTSTSPTGGPGAWSAPVSVGTVIESLACPTVSLCV